MTRVHLRKLSQELYAQISRLWQCTAHQQVALRVLYISRGRLHQPAGATDGMEACIECQQSSSRLPILSYDVILSSGHRGLFCGEILSKESRNQSVAARAAYMLGGILLDVSAGALRLPMLPRIFYPLFVQSDHTYRQAASGILGIPTEWGSRWILWISSISPACPTSPCPPTWPSSRQAECAFPERLRAASTATSRARQAISTACSTISFKGGRHESRAPVRASSGTDRLTPLSHPLLNALLMADTPHWGSLPHRTSDLFRRRHAAPGLFLGNYYPKGARRSSPMTWAAGSRRAAGESSNCSSGDAISSENGARGRSPYFNRSRTRIRLSRVSRADRRLHRHALQHVRETLTRAALRPLAYRGISNRSKAH